jgi:hypothetical protein
MIEKTTFAPVNTFIFLRNCIITKFYKRLRRIVLFFFGVMFLPFSHILIIELIISPLRMCARFPFWFSMSMSLCFRTPADTTR